MKNRRTIFIILLILVICISVFYIFFRKNMAKNLKIGNNTTSQEIVNNILNLSSYEATIEVEVKSNKNENKYKIKQVYMGPEENSQEIIEPSNIAGIKIIKKQNTLTLENSKLNLTNLLENYEYVSNNHLDLNSFVENYKKNSNSEWQEDEEEIKMRTVNGEKTKTEVNLYISKKTGKPIKMEIQDANKNTVVYILYKEVIVNS